MRRHLLPRLALVLLLCCASALADAGERGYFGFAPKVSTAGFLLNPTVQRVEIYAVTPGSPAARGGLQAGDEIVTVEDTPVVGSKALALRKLATREVGQILHLSLRRVDGSVYAVALVAVAKP